MINPFMNGPSSGLQSEQNLLQDLIDDNISAGGVECFYLQKEQLNLDEVFRESTIVDYKAGFEIEMMIARVSNFNGDGDLFSKFGMSSSDEVTLIVSTRRFGVEGAKHAMVKPLEEDLIFMPMTSTLWKIRKVKQDEEYYQFGRNYVWRLECGLYNPSHESFAGDIVQSGDMNLGSEAIDDLELIKVFGIEGSNQQDQGEALREASNETIAGEFNPDDPFGSR